MEREEKVGIANLDKVIENIRSRSKHEKSKAKGMHTVEES